MYKKRNNNNRRGKASQRPVVNSLPELLRLLRQRHSKSDAGTALNAIADACGGCCNIRYEVVDTKPPYPGKSTQGKYEYLGDKNISRAIICADRKRADFTNRLNRELNGVILEYPSWNVLALPLPAFSPINKTSFINNVDSYNIYGINDGTIVTFYWYDGHWVMASTHGYDVGKLKWMQDISYEDALVELLAYYPEFNLDSLNKNNCYSIGFRHPAYHPLQCDTPKVWFVNCSELTTINKVLDADGLPHILNYSTNIGLPLQTPFSFDELQPEQVYDTICKYSEEALTSYVESLKTTPYYNYGYFMRSNDPALPDYMISSSLLDLVRKSVYELPRSRGENEVLITHENRIDYITLRAYLNPSSKYEFISIFPQYESYYKKFDDLFGKLINRMLTVLRQKLEPDGYLEQVLYNELVNAKLQYNDPELEYIVMDFIRDPKFLEVHFKYLL
jgi:hypothetical protein